jgi:hypothetical protein
MNHASSFHSLSALCVASVVIAGSFCGCTTGARFAVQAEHADAASIPAQSYRLSAAPQLGGAEIPAGAREQILRDVRTALAERGLFEAPEGVAPTLEIDVELAFGPARQKALALAVPVYSEGAQPVSRADGLGRAGAPGGSVPRKVGEREITQVVTVHPKALRLTAYPLRPAPAGRAAASWSVVVTNEDEATDMVAYARLMVAAAMDWIGRSTDSPTEVVLTHRDRRVTLLAQATQRAPQVAAGAASASVARARNDG